MIRDTFFETICGAATSSTGVCKLVFPIELILTLLLINELFG